MHESVYALLGVVGTGVMLFLFKWFGGGKGKEVVGVDTERAANAMAKASELLGQRAEIAAKGEADRKRIEDKLAIKDPVERLEAIADELKDL